MLKIEAYSPGGKDPQVISASRLLVRDAHGNPILIAVAYDQNQYIVAHAEDDDFETLLATLGAKAARVINWIDV